MSEEIRMLPHAMGQEKSVLSSLMKNVDLLAESPLDPEIFYLRSHRIIYKTLRELGDGDLVSLVGRLDYTGELEDVGGPSAVTDIYTYATGPYHFRKHLEILRHCHARRMSIKACGEAIEAAHDMSDGEDSANYLEALSAPVSSVFDTAAAVEEPPDTKALALQFVEAFERRVAGEETRMGIPFGITHIDQVLHGVHPQHYGVISGRPGGGKSTGASQIASNMSTDGVPVLYIQLERTEISVFTRCVIQQSLLPHWSVVAPSNPTKNELQRIKRTVESLTNGKLHIRKPPDRRLSTVLAEIRRYVRLHGIKVAFVDQIGLVQGARKSGFENTEAELRGVSNALQEIAHELRITVIVLCQENADGDTKSARAIEEDADWWLSIVQERDKKRDDYGQHKYVLVAKDSHNGKAGERLPLVLCKDTLRFIEGRPPVEKTEEKATRFRR